MAYDASTGTTVLVAGTDLTGSDSVDTWTWGGVAWTQQRPATSPPETFAGAMAYDPSTKTVVLFNAWGQTWLWNGTAKTWTRQFPTTSPQGRQWPSLAYDASTGRIVLFGGLLDGDFDDTWVWSGSQKTWTKLNPASHPSRRYLAAMATDPATKTVVLFGGRDWESGTALGDTWTWNGLTRTWTKQSPTVSPTSRFGAAMARYDAGAAAVLFGGETYSPEPIAFSDTWAWNGSTGSWTPQAALGPRPRAEASVAYDAARGVVVLFGGYGPYEVASDPTCVTWGCFASWATLNDTWTFGAP